MSVVTACLPPLSPPPLSPLLSLPLLPLASNVSHRHWHSPRSARSVSQACPYKTLSIQTSHVSTHYRVWWANLGMTHLVPPPLVNDVVAKYRMQARAERSVEQVRECAMSCYLSCKSITWCITPTVVSLSLPLSLSRLLRKWRRLSDWQNKLVTKVWDNYHQRLLSQSFLSPSSLFISPIPPLTYASLPPSSLPIQTFHSCLLLCSGECSDMNRYANVQRTALTAHNYYSHVGGTSITSTECGLHTSVYVHAANVLCVNPTTHSHRIWGPRMELFIPFPLVEPDCPLDNWAGKHGSLSQLEFWRYKNNVVYLLNCFSSLGFSGLGIRLVNSSWLPLCESHDS